MTQKKYRVFVYGTLMSGGRNAHLLKNSTLINDDATTAEASFLMEQFNSTSSLGKHTPGVRRNGSKYIKGEIWEVDEKTLALLDELEGYDPNKPFDENKYIREEIKMGDHSTALIYIINAEVNPPITKPHNRIFYDVENNVQSWDRVEPASTP